MAQRETDDGGLVYPIPAPVVRVREFYGTITVSAQASIVCRFVFFILNREKVFNAKRQKGNDYGKNIHRNL